MMFPIAILAGGLATRLQPITETVPKSLIKVAGRPFIYHQLDWFREEGIDRVVLCVGYLGEQIVDAVGDGAAFGLSVEYSFDGDKLLGTGGALKKAIPMLGKTFFVLYGDSYLQCSFSDVQTAFEVAGKPALMTVFRNEGRWDRSNAVFNDARLVKFDKRKPDPEMQYIDYGLSVIDANAFSSYGLDEVLDLADMFSALSARGQLAGYEVSKRFYEMGSRAGLRETEEFLLQRNKK